MFFFFTRKLLIENKMWVSLNESKGRNYFYHYLMHFYKVFEILSVVVVVVALACDISLDISHTI